MYKKEIIINTSKLIFFLPIGLISGFVGGYLLSFIPNLLLFIPFILFPGTEPIREPIQAIFSNLGGIAIAINISLLLKPDFLDLNKFLFVWGLITGLIILIYIPLITNLSGFESIEESKIKYTIELISLILGYSIFFKFYKK
tara:strand:+ start:137 stop:562 length:426 start_codon:yes stop_codon:yes gene_type:complete